MNSQTDRTAHFVTTVLPGQRSTGGEVVSQQLIDELRAQQIHTVVYGSQRKGDPAGDLHSVVLGTRTIEAAASRLGTIAWGLRGALTGEAITAAKHSTERERLLVRRSIPTNSVVFVDHLQAAPLVRGVLAKRSVYIAHNHESRAYAEQAQLERSRLRRRILEREAYKLARLECEVMDKVDEVWTLTDSDARSHASDRPGKQIRVIDVVPTWQGGPRGARGVWDVGLIGTWTWGANKRGLEWFLKEVVPLIPRNCRIAVAGRANSELATPPNVVMVGRVPSAAKFLSTCSVVVVPSVTGGGIQIKTLDAIASGRPVVVSAVATRGIEDIPESVATCRTSAEMAIAVLEALEASPEDLLRLHGASRSWLQTRRERMRATIKASVAALFRSQ
jgi:polysaccharide biosynthesis protein PslH